jgi:hypothetical protein
MLIRKTPINNIYAGILFLKVLYIQTKKNNMKTKDVSFRISKSFPKNNITIPKTIW